MAPPATRMRADQPAPATSRPAARTPATRVAAKSRLAGKPAVRLSVNAAKRKKSGGAQAAAEAAAGTAPKEPPDPRLTQAIDKVKRNAKKLKKHDPARDKADQAQDAAEPPEKEVLSRAQANKVGEIKSEMDAAKKPSVDEKPPQEKSFLETLEEEIERVMPKKIEDTENFMDKEDRKTLKDSMSGNIEAQKQQVTGPVKATAGAKPDEEAVTPKPVITPLPEALPKAAPEPVGARNAMPEPLPDEKVSLQSSKDEAQRQFDENKITPTQLQKANDPRFTAALKAKEDVDAHADAAPQQYREYEQKTLTTAVGRAVAAERRGTGAMLGAHDKSGGDVRGDQGKAMKDDKDRRQEVVDFIEKKFAATKESVETKLATLETEVTTMFDEGIEKNIKSMKDEATRKKNAWKEDRYYSYGIMTRPDLWLYDKVRGIDRQPKVKKIYVEAAEQFTRDMKALVKRIAAFVETRLKEAKDEVEKGRKEIHDFVGKLDGKLKDVGLEAEKAVTERFDELTQSIEDKKKDLASNLAQRYKDAHDKAGEAIKEMQAEDKGLVDALLDKLKQIIEILTNFRRRIMSMLRKAANAIDLIVSDPIGFLKNLLKAIKQGISQFVGRIWTHLKEGFMAWLFGSLATMGVTIPKDLSLPSILQLVLDVLGITYAKIRGKVVKIIGERNVALLEGAWAAVQTLLNGGPAALWEQLKEYISNLKEMVVDAIQNWLITRIIESAATKIAMMFNPAGAIIQAIMIIYRTVMFFIENIDRILAFVESIIESVYNIATGAISSAADWIEKALARTIPIIIGFLARLLGISGLADKIREFINKIQTRIDKALDKVIDKVVGGVKKLIGAGKAIAGKIFNWWKARKQFKAEDGQTHSLYYVGEGKGARLTVASDPDEIDDFIFRKKKAVNALGDKKKKEQLTTRVIPAAETKLTEIRSAEAALKAADIGSATDKAGKGTDANQTLYAALEARLEEIKPLLAKLIFKVDEYPPMRLPTYADNVQPTHARVDYLNEDRISSQRLSSTNSGKHKGHLEGWEELKMAGLTDNSKWVRMHLFTHRFGGQPTDSNLVPAEGSPTNKEMEKLEDHVDKVVAKGDETIWYDVQVGLGATVNIDPAYQPPGKKKSTQQYMNSLTARWGTYTLDPGSGKFKEKVQKPSVRLSPDPPRFPPPGTARLPSIQDAGEETLAPIMGGPYTEWHMRVFKEAVNRMKKEQGRATSVTNLDTKLRALRAPYVMTGAMKRRLLDLVHSGKLSI